MEYLPKWEPGKREPDRDFLWTVIHSVQPEYGKKLLAEAMRVRAKLAVDAQATKAEKP